MASTTLLSLKSLCGGGLPSSHPSLGCSFISFFYDSRDRQGAGDGFLRSRGAPTTGAVTRLPLFISSEEAVARALSSVAQTKEFNDLT